MIEPLVPPVTARRSNAGVGLGDRFAGGERWVHDLEACWNRVDQGDMGASTVSHHGQHHSHPGASLDCPRAVVVLDHIVVVVHRLIGALHHETLISWFEVEVGRGVTQPKSVVQPASIAVASKHDFGVANVDEFGHRHNGEITVGRAAFV